MNTNKAAYWIALGVLALGLNSEYRQGKFEALHQIGGRISDHAGAVLCQLSARAERTLASARVLKSRPDFSADDFLRDSAADEIAQAEVTRDRVRESVRDQIRAQAEVIRAQIDMQRAQVREFQLAARSQVRMARTVSQRVVVCPKTAVRVVMSSVTDSDGDLDNLRSVDLRNNDLRNNDSSDDSSE
jgi:hypothetical protein